MLGWRRELFLNNVSKPAATGPFSPRQVLPLKLEGVEENQQRGVRNWVLYASGFGAALRGGCVILEAWKYICRVGMSPARLSAERGEGEGTRGRASGLQAPR